MKHHTLLHMTPSPHAPLPSSSSGDLDPSSQASTLIACSSTSSYPPPIINSTKYPDHFVLFETAVVFVKKTSWLLHSMPCYTRFSIATQFCFVSFCWPFLYGIGEFSVNSEKAVDIIVQSQDSCYHASFTALSHKPLKIISRSLI